MMSEWVLKGISKGTELQSRKLVNKDLGGMLETPEQDNMACASEILTTEYFFMDWVSPSLLGE